MGRIRTRVTPDGATVRATERIERVNGKWRVIIRWLDESGNAHDPASLAKPEPMRSRAHSGINRRAAMASKGQKVELNRLEISDARVEISAAMGRLSKPDRERIDERMRRKPGEGIGVSARDCADIERARADVVREALRDGLLRGKRKHPSEIFQDVLRDLRAIDLRRITPDELDS